MSFTYTRDGETFLDSEDLSNLLAEIFQASKYRKK